MKAVQFSRFGAAEVAEAVGASWPPAGEIVVEVAALIRRIPNFEDALTMPRSCRPSPVARPSVGRRGRDGVVDLAVGDRTTRYAGRQLA
jgi:hypothetical protein